MARRLRAAGEDVAVVLRDGVVMGLLGLEVAAGSGGTAGDAMDPGPSTVRADVPLSTVLERMRRRHLAVQVVTDPDGRLIGLVRP